MAMVMAMVMAIVVAIVTAYLCVFRRLQMSESQPHHLHQSANRYFRQISPSALVKGGHWLLLVTSSAGPYFAAPQSFCIFRHSGNRALVSKQTGKKN